jgi:hypothetical protein
MKDDEAALQAFNLLLWSSLSEDETRLKIVPNLIRHATSNNIFTLLVFYFYALLSYSYLSCSLCSQSGALANHAALFAGAALMSLMGTNGTTTWINGASTGEAGATNPPLTLLAQSLKLIRRCEVVFGGRFSDYSEFQGLGKSFKFESKLKIHLHLISQVSLLLSPIHLSYSCIFTVY